MNESGANSSHCTKSQFLSKNSILTKHYFQTYLNLASIIDYVILKSFKKMNFHAKNVDTELDKAS